MRIVVVGGGMAAHRFVERTLEASPTAGIELTIISEEVHAPYDRIQLGRVVAGDPAHGLALRGLDWYADRGVTLRLKDRVVRIDRAARIVRTESGASVEYDRLVIATGGQPFVPPLPGVDLEGVLTYRTLEDAEEIARRARPGARAVVAGGGLLGLEVARALQKLGCEVEVVEMAPRLLPRQLDAEGARVLARELEGLGVGLRLLSRIRGVVRVEDRLEVDLGDTSLSADFVIVSAGIRPNDRLAREAGIACDDAGGVLVDDGLATSDAHVFAIGECVRHRGELYGLVAPCYEMADALAVRLSGERARFRGATPSARLKIDEIDVAAVGDSLAEGVGVSALSWVEDDQYRRIVLRDGRIIGAIAVGAGSEFPRLQEAVATRARVRGWQLERFDREGRLWREGAARPIDQWADAAVVCTCTGVTCGKLRAACADGARTSVALREATGAGSVCGTCQPLVAELAGEAHGSQRASGGRGLAVAAGAGLVLVLATWGLAPLPMSDSFVTGPGIDWLWRDGFWKQVTGFVLIGLTLASLLLSLRKRVSSFSLGSVTSWRVAHAALGAATVVGLVAHTGLRMGANLNFVLMLCFTAAVLLGSVAGLVTHLERRLPPEWGGALRKGWTSAHVFVVWPLPVLAAAHVLAVYFY